MRHLLVLIALSSLIALASLPATVATAQEASDTARAEARQHFQRAITLFEESRYPEALIEFEAAYAAIPNHRVLFNIGNVHAALGHAVEAVDAYERYLAEAGATIDAARRAAVEAALATQRTRLGTVMVTSNVDGATLVVNGVDTDRTTPMDAPLRLAIGRYAIELRLSGYEGATRSVTVAGQSEQSLAFEMTRIVGARGNLRIRATAPATEIMVDGEVVGTTPIDEELVVEPGVREVVGRRAGYRVAREHVTVVEGATVDVDLRMDRDPEARSEDLGVVAIALPDADATLRVDGEPVAIVDGRVELPVGAHALVLEVDERQRHEETIDVPAGGELALSPRLRWTDGARGTRTNRASNYRTIGWVVGIAGVVATGVSVGLMIASVGDITEYNDLYAASLLPGGCNVEGEGLDCDMVHGEGSDAILDGEAAMAKLILMGSGIGLGVGVVAMALGITLLVLSDSDEDIDAAASAPTASLGVGPGSVTLLGTF